MQNPFSENDYKLLQSLVGLTQAGLKDTLGRFLAKRYKKVVNAKEYIYAQGNIPIALVAHMDTVFKSPPDPDEIFYDKQKGVVWSCAGLGADDRAGVFAILRIIQRGYLPTVIFTTDEEIGGGGASALVRDFPQAPCRLSYIIELDRRGINDCVFYQCDNDEFVKYVESFGFEENWGTFTDISIICPKWKIAGVNLSVGYEDEHDYIERLYVRHLYKTINRVIKMLLCAADAPEFEYVESTLPFNWASWVGTLSEGDFDYLNFDDYARCVFCNEEEDEDLMIEIFDADGKKVYCCLDCCEANKVDWCMHCGQAFVANPEKKCPVCGAINE